MDIPVWAGDIGNKVKPLELGLENLNIKAALEGIKAGTELPSTATAISEGVQGLAKNYYENLKNEQETQANAIELKRARELEQQTTETEAKKLEAQKDEYVNKIRLNELRTELANNLKSGDPQKLIQSAFDPKYSEVIDKNQWEQLKDKAWPYLTPEQQEGIYHDKINKERQGLILKDQMKMAQDYRDASVAFLKDAETDGIIEKVDPANKNKLALLNNNRFDFLIPEAYEMDDAGTGLKLDPKTLLPIKKPYVTAKEMPKSDTSPRIVFDKKTGEQLGLISGESYKRLQTFKNAKGIGEAGGLIQRDRLPVTFLRPETTGQQRDVTVLEPNQVDGRTSFPTPKQAATETPKQLTPRNATNVFAANIYKTPFIPGKDAFFGENSPLPQQFSASIAALGRLPESVVTAKKDSINQLLEMAGSPTYKESTFFDERLEVLDKVTKELLHENFKQDKGAIAVDYNPEALKKRKERIEMGVKALTFGGMLPGEAISSFFSAESPEEWYVSDNEGKLKAQISTLMGLIESETKARLIEEAKRKSATTNVIAKTTQAISDYK